MNKSMMAIEIQNVMNEFGLAKKSEMRDLIGILKADFETQVNALNERGDVSWDCYSPSNWESLLEVTQDLEKLLDKGD